MRGWMAMVHPDDRAGVTLRFKNLTTDPNSADVYRVVHPSGVIRWVSARRCHILAEDGHVVLVGGVTEDITDRMARESKRESETNRLETLVVERTRALEEANTELRAFSHTAAHDLKSPLHGIAGLAF